MSNDEQQLLNVIKLNRTSSEKLLTDTSQLLDDLEVETSNTTIQTISAISKSDEAIAASLLLLKQRGVQVELPNIKHQKIELPKASISRKKEWDELVQDAYTEGLYDTSIDDLLTPVELACADAEYKDIKLRFSKATRMNKTDIAFLMLTVALQVTRQYIFSNEKFRFKTAEEADTAIKGRLKKVIPDEWQKFLLGPVPYDAVKRLDPTTETTGLSANTHRYRTLGHDPVLGWIFGPVNILTSSLTKTDFVSTYQ